MTDLKTLTSEVCPKCKGCGWVFIEVDGVDRAKECECVFARRIAKINEQSGLPKEVCNRLTFQGFKTETEEQKQMKELAETFTAKRGFGLGYFGKSGTGKTHICTAVCQELAKKGLAYRYFSYRTEMHELLNNYYGNGKMKEWQNCDVLFIDDLFKFSADKEGNINPRELQLLYELINYRALQRKITIFSSEYTLKEITKIDEAIGSRIYEMVYPYAMKCKGTNYRIKGERNDNT